MKTYKSYIERVATLTPSVIGYRLLPFNLGHSIALKSSKSKFISGEYNGFYDINSIYKSIITDKSLIPEFVFAVLVCSITYDEFREEVNNGSFGKALEEVIKRLKTDKFYIVNEIHAFALYIQQGTDAPLYDIKASDNDTEVVDSPIEPEENMLSTLMSDCGYTRNECLNLPLTETLSAYLLYAHKMGSIVIRSKALNNLMNKGKQ
jgi:hypothetical protein